MSDSTSRSEAISDIVTMFELSAGYWSSGSTERREVKQECYAALRALGVEEDEIVWELK
jgi:hypothetical protein